MTYVLTGEGLAQYMFTLDSRTGIITLVRDIKGSGLEDLNQYTVSDRNT